MAFPNRTTASLATIAGSMLLCGVTALAQSAPGSMQQPGTTSGTQTTQPGGMNSPANQSAGMNTATTQTGQSASMDKMFVKKAMQGSMAEIQLGQLALQKSNNDQVKQFAQRMIDDHGKLNDQIKPIAQQLGVQPPDNVSKKDQAVMTKLQALNGDAFDKAYMKDMVKDHKTDLNEFKTEAASGSNPEVKNAASQGAQVIQQHLQMAEDLNQKTSTMASNNGGK